MQTVAVNIQDGYMQSFINYVQTHSENIAIAKDSNIEQDFYFYGRQKELHQIRSDIKSGTMEMLSQEQYEKEIEQFFSELEQ